MADRVIRLLDVMLPAMLLVFGGYALSMWWWLCIAYGEYVWGLAYPGAASCVAAVVLARLAWLSREVQEGLGK